MKERNAGKEIATFLGSQQKRSASISALNSQTKLHEAVTSIKQKPKAAQEEATHWQSTGRGGRKMQRHEGESQIADGDPEPHNKTVKAGMVQSEQNERGQRE